MTVYIIDADNIDFEGINKFKKMGLITNGEPILRSIVLEQTIQNKDWPVFRIDTPYGKFKEIFEKFLPELMTVVSGNADSKTLSDNAGVDTEVDTETKKKEVDKVKVENADPEIPQYLQTMQQVVNTVGVPILEKFGGGLAQKVN
ncbi:hypothetical protein NTE_02541 [Candidatus Nitrososphaera evergladensis SR1]|uniref:Uncharacterized protein n=1 Tax=Candidatus Nitrososphaera evergladensis SR1 TaxID=1459636 RepID=A0A075MTW6_9ARCH|nr:hypothetical protein [Candidatus Nitrososphaera evergladensis]AIF84588.1 hypothetical protein NTE_02541 [Candidatus Nitrososphaera evergladensis SR1]